MRIHLHQISNSKVKNFRSANKCFDKNILIYKKVLQRRLAQLVGIGRVPAWSVCSQFVSAGIFFFSFPSFFQYWPFPSSFQYWPFPSSFQYWSFFLHIFNIGPFCQQNQIAICLRGNLFCSFYLFNFGLFLANTSSWDYRTGGVESMS